MPDNPHMGHRQRMLDKFRRFGLEIFSDHEVLEMLLYFAVRQGDTNPTAHRLMQRFGSLHAVLEATEDELQTGRRRRSALGGAAAPVLCPVSPLSGGCGENGAVYR